MDSARFHCGFISSFSYSLLDRNSSKVLDLSEFEKKTGDVTFSSFCFPCVLARILFPTFFRDLDYIFCVARLPRQQRFTQERNRDKRFAKHSHIWNSIPLTLTITRTQSPTQKRSNVSGSGAYGQTSQKEKFYV